MRSALSKHKGFTLAEVLITLAIIVVIAAISIPSVIINFRQQEFKTGLRKAVSELNAAIAANIALNGETPYDTEELFEYLKRHMSVIKSGQLAFKSMYVASNGTSMVKIQNYAFYTADGIRYEFDDDAYPAVTLKLHESDTKACLAGYIHKDESACIGCGSLGLNNNPDKTTKPPCFVVVDVNGDRKPYPANVNCTDESCARQNQIKAINPDSKLISDVFTILITDKAAIPYGIAAQKAMYQAREQ